MAARELVCLLKLHSRQSCGPLMLQFNNPCLHFRACCCYTDRLRHFSSSSSSHSSPARIKRLCRRAEATAFLVANSMLVFFFFSLCVLSWARLTPITIEVVEVPLDKKLVPISDKSITKDGKLNVLENKIQLVQKENRFHKPELVRLLKFFQMSRPWISQWIGTIHSPSVFEIDCANSHCAVRRYSKCYSNQSLLNDGLHLEGSYISALYLSFASYRNITKFTKTKITRTLVAKNNCDVRLKRNERTIIPQQETFEG